MRISVFAVLVLGVATVAVAQNPAPAANSWEYEGKRGALVWGKLDPAYQLCSKGHEQAPIDIRGAHLNTKLPPIEFHYIAAPVRLENDGHTVVVRVAPGSY